MEWLRGGPMSETCILFTVKEWDPATPILVCGEASHDFTHHWKDIKAKLPQLDRWIEFGAAEFDSLAEILRPMPAFERHRLRDRVLDLKKYFGGRTLTTEELRRIAVSPQTVGVG